MNDHKTIVITGSSRGLGFATARCCLAAEANVVICSEDPADLNSALEELGSRPNLAGMVCDVSKRRDIHALLQFAVDLFGRVDVWVNNAGTSSPTGAVVDVPLDIGDVVIGTNILGTYYGSVLAVRQFQRQRAGRLINIVGRGEKKPVPTANLYGSSKTWIRNFTLAMAKESKQDAIDFCVYNPGFIVTRLSTKVRAIRGYEKLAESVRKIIPVLGGSADEAATELCKLALQPGPVPLSRSRQRPGVLLPLLLRRLVLRQAPPIEMSEIEVEIVEPEK